MEVKVGAATSVESQDCTVACLSEDVEPGAATGPEPHGITRVCLNEEVGPWSQEVDLIV
jgi:hypothetical protein